MRLFEQKFVDLLNSHCGSDEGIYYVGLGKFDFQFTFGNLRNLKSEYKVEFLLNGKEYLWEEGPNDAPVWRLIDQIPERFSLVSSDCIKMHLKSGDSVSFYTSEEPYENFIVEFSRDEKSIVMEVF